MKLLCILILGFLAWIASLTSFPGTALSAAPDSLGMLRAVHIGGNWGLNADGIAEQPEDFYQWLRDLKVNWAGITIDLFIESSMDSTVERNYGNVPNATFTDEVIIEAIRGFKRHNLNVYFTFSINTQLAVQSEYPVHRWQLGDPDMPNQDSNIKSENWPWDPDHPDHEAFVESFWNSYTKEAMYFARICESEGVELYAPGAEMDRLFRTRSGGRWPNDFKTYLQAMVDSVRSVYSGLVSYEMHWSALGYNEFDPGSDHLWKDLGLDVIGISAYFKLTEEVPTSVIIVSELEEKWEDVFNQYLIPLKNYNPDLPILFLEFGYVDVVGSPNFADLDAFKERIFKDKDLNGLDDGEETHANIHEAFFRVNENHNRIVQGMFLWGNHISSNASWEISFGQMRTSSIRNKLSEEVVRTWYTTYAPYIPVPEIPVLLSPSNEVSDVQVDPELTWQPVSGAEVYNVQVSKLADLSTPIFDLSNILDTTYTIHGLTNNKTYYWRVQAENIGGESDWSEPFSFTTEMLELNPPSHFTASDIPNDNGHQLKLSWTLSPDDAIISQYYIYRSRNAEFVEPALPLERFTTNDELITAEADSTILIAKVQRGIVSYKDKNVPLNGVPYYYWIQAVSENGSSEKVAAGYKTDVKEIKPSEVMFNNPCPNPFNQMTTITYSLPENTKIILTVYNVSGQAVSVLKDKYQQAGNYSISWNATDMPTGLYFCTLKANGVSKTKKMVLVK